MADSGWGSSNDAGGWGDSNNNDSSFNDDKGKRLKRYSRISTSFKAFFLGGDSGERKKGCFKCGEEGHNKADCPQAGDEPPKKCFKCGGDHFAKECEKPDVCRMCGEEGHMSKECSGAKTHSITKEDGT